MGFPKFQGGVGGYARFVAICPPDWPHGVSMGQVPESPLPKAAQAAALGYEAGDEGEVGLKLTQAIGRLALIGLTLNVTIGSSVFGLPSVVAGELGRPVPWHGSWPPQEWR